MTRNSVSFSHPEDPLLVDTGRGFTVSYHNRNLYSTRAPREKAEQIAAAQTVPENTLLIVPSPLLGYGLSVLLETLKASCHILCVEADQKLMALSLEHIDESLLKDERLSLIRTDDAARAADYARKLGPWNFRRTLLVPLSGGSALSPHIYRSIQQGVEQEIRQYWQNRMTLVHMGRLWVGNILSNLAELSSEHDISELATSKPVVVAGAGESLEQAVHWIRELRDSVFLLAVDTAFPAVTAAGLVPDLVVAVESQLANLNDFIGLVDIPVPLACDISSYPAVLRRYRGRVHFFASEFTTTHLFSRLRDSGLLPLQIPPLGSVGNTAIYLALQLTRRAVFLAGLDFSYTPGKPHAWHTPSHILHLSHSTRLHPSPLFDAAMKRPLMRTKDKWGNHETTDLVLYSYAQQARELIAPHGRVCDAGMKGLAIGPVAGRSTEEIIRTVRAAAQAEAPSAPPGQSPATARQVQFHRGEQFLRELADKLSQLVEMGRNTMEEMKEGARGFPPELLSLLTEMDFLYIDFPDPPPLPAENPGFLARVLSYALYYRNRIQRILTQSP